MCAFPHKSVSSLIFIYHTHLWFKFEKFLKQRMPVSQRQLGENSKVKVKIHHQPSLIWDPELHRMSDCQVDKAQSLCGSLGLQVGYKQDRYTQTLTFVYVTKSCFLYAFRHLRMSQNTFIGMLLHGFIQTDEILLQSECFPGKKKYDLVLHGKFYLSEEAR